MTWLALGAEVVVELRSHQVTMWDAWDQWTPTRDEASRLEVARATTARRISVLHAVGKVREARILESRQRAAKRRAAKRRNAIGRGER